MKQPTLSGLDIDEREKTMLKKNLTSLFALALVALAVPAFAGDVIGDYEDTFVEGSESTLTISSYDVDTEEYSWFTYEALEDADNEQASVAPIREVDCQDTDDVSVGHFPTSD